MHCPKFARLRTQYIAPVCQALTHVRRHASVVGETVLQEAIMWLITADGDSHGHLSDPTSEHEFFYSFPLTG